MSKPSLYTPKYFSFQLTGNGGARGKICEAQNPINLGIPVADGAINVASAMLDSSFANYSTAEMQTTSIPFYIISAEVWEKTATASVVTATKEPIVFASDGTKPLYIALEPHLLLMRHISATDENPSYNTFSVAYRLTVAKAIDMTEDIPIHTFRSPVLPSMLENPLHTGDVASDVADILVSNNAVINVFCLDPASQAIAIANALTIRGTTVDTDVFNEYLQSYSLYDGICKRAYAWRNYAAKEFETVCNNGNMSDVAHAIESFSAYDVALDEYKQIFDLIHSRFNEDESHELCRENVNLFLFDDMRKVEKNLSKMRVFESSFDPEIPQNLTPEQTVAVNAKGPLTIVEATAGSGKTHTIVERVRHMIRSGISPESITAVSFTNAAADNLAKRANAEIAASTIARMIHDIYTLNYPTHNLATAGTLANTFDALYPSSPEAATLGRLLRAASRNDARAMAKLNAFVEDNLDKVIEMLNAAKQTTLELEIIIAYQLVDTLQEPDGTKRDYIILDEVQDTSVFEFAYLMRYAVLHRSNVFLVGDAAQCLYAFRGADPRAMNVFESSPLFETCKLQTNFRSNPGILDFANELLCDIEANEKANLKLIPHLSRTIENCTSSTVGIDTCRFKLIKDKRIEMLKSFKKSAVPFIDSCLERGEQVAILTYMQDDVLALKSTCEENVYEWMEPDVDTVSIIPKRVNETNVLSKYVAYKARDVRFLPVGKSTFSEVVKENVLSQLEELSSSPERVRDSATKQLSKWKAANSCALDLVYSHWKKGKVDDNFLIDHVRMSLLNAEIDHNAMSRHVVTDLNEERTKEEIAQNAKLVFSTIHSAKGLEFDNVVIVMDDYVETTEDKKRLYYVALTRAKKREHIIALEPQATFPIKDRYNKAVQSNAIEIE